jgi:hypothetical protein
MLSEDKKWRRVSLRFSGVYLPVENIEKKINIAPSYIGRKGEHIRGNPKFAKHDSNVWVWEYPASADVPFEGQISELLDLLESEMAGLKEILSTPETMGEVFLGFGSGNGQGAAEFSPHLLKRIGECGLMLSLDLYPPSIDEEDGILGSGA